MAGGVGMRVEEDKAKGSTAVLFFRRDDLPADIAEKAAEIRRLLRLPPDQQKFVLTYSPMRGAENELAVNSRSMLQILQAFASYVDVPEQHLQDRARRAGFRACLTGRSGTSGGFAAADGSRSRAYAAVQYRGHWFWVDNSDWLTKRALTAVMFFFTLADTGTPRRLPLITIPAQ